MNTSKTARLHARELRKNHTGAEKVLWNKLRNSQFIGLKFLRQHPVFYRYNNKQRYFIADFYCHKFKLVIEIDGKIHVYKKNYDQARTGLLETKKIKVVRFTNEEVLTNINKVLIELERYIEVNKSEN